MPLGRVLTGGLESLSAPVASALADTARAEGVRVLRVRWWVRPSRPSRWRASLWRYGLAQERLEEARAGRAGLPDVGWGQLSRVGRWRVVLDDVDEPRAVGPGGEPVPGYRGGGGRAPAVRIS